MLMLTKEFLIEQIDSVLPQTQCTRCGYPSCKEYAKALANNEAEINQCPPGGNEGIRKLSHLLNKPVMPLNPENGKIKHPEVAIIDEEACIGCTLCIKACPVDAILGSNKMMHTVIEAECTGCDLCISVCPVDCISMIKAPYSQWSSTQAQVAKDRFDHHNYRKIRDIQARELRLLEQSKLLEKVKKDHEAQKSDMLLQIIAAVNKPN